MTSHQKSQVKHHDPPVNSSLDSLPSLIVLALLLFGPSSASRRPFIVSQSVTGSLPFNPRRPACPVRCRANATKHQPALHPACASGTTHGECTSRAGPKLSATLHSLSSALVIEAPALRRASTRSKEA